MCAQERGDLAVKRNLRSVKIRPASERPDLVPRIILSQRGYIQHMYVRAAAPEIRVKSNRPAGAERIGGSPRWDTWLRSPDAFLGLRRSRGVSRLRRVSGLARQGKVGYHRTRTERIDKILDFSSFRRHDWYTYEREKGNKTFAWILDVCMDSRCVQTNVEIRNFTQKERHKVAMANCSLLCPTAVTRAKSV